MRAKVAHVVSRIFIAVSPERAQIVQTRIEHTLLHLMHGELRINESITVVASQIEQVRKLSWRSPPSYCLALKHAGDMPRKHGYPSVVESK